MQTFCGTQRHSSACPLYQLPKKDPKEHLFTLQEVLQVPELMTELRKLFGPSVRLLLILERLKLTGVV